MKIAAQVLALLACPLFAVSAQAASNSDEVRRTVPYGDLDLTSAEGQDILNRRLSSAVRKVCAPTNRRDLRELAASHRCAKIARNDADTHRQLAIAASNRRIGVALAKANGTDGAK